MTATTPPPGGGETLAPKFMKEAGGETSKQTFILGEQTSKDTSVRPFSFRASDEDVADLKRRIAAT